MPTTSRLAAVLRRLVLASGLVPALCALAQTPSGPVAPAAATALPDYLITATRSAAAADTIGSAVEVIGAAELARRQLTQLSAALGGAAGAPPVASGAPGAGASLFLRGANSNQTLFLVDGIRFNDPNTDYQVWLGGARVSATDGIEVVRGPQSTLYGGEAVGGVVAVRAQPGRGAARAALGAEGGSFGTVQGHVSAQGAAGAWAYNLSAAGGTSDNARANNDFTSVTTVLRVDRVVSDALAVGATWRGFHSAYGSPGDRFTNDPDNEERERNFLATLFADFTHAPTLRSHAVLGGQVRRFVSDNPGPFGEERTVVKTRRAVIDWQTTWAPGGAHRVTAGFTGEANHASSTGFGAINQRQRLAAFFAQEEWAATDDLHLTAGLRRDDHDTFGHATTGRVTAAWRTARQRLKWRASYGTAFRAPAFLDLFGRSDFFVGNPALRPERARGWDAGADFRLPGDRGELSATWFETRLRDLIAFDFAAFPGTVRNVERARTRGVELAGRWRLPGEWTLRAAGTYLEADNRTQGNRLLRRPRWSGSLDVARAWAGGFNVGGGAVFAAQREDVDAATFARIDGEDYVVARLYAAWPVNARLTLRARVENLLDEHYEEVNGFPQLGRGVYGGAEWRF